MSSNMQFSMSAEKRLTGPWEECVLWVYDDKVPKRHISGKLQYPEWDGGPVRGTLTIGLGHTDAAGAPKIVQGLRMTEDEAWQLLAKDLAPCNARVNRLIKVPVTQHQHDAVVDGDFNCPSMTPKLADLINAGNPKAVPAKMLQYTSSRGEHMEGLVHRRTAEINWFNTPDHVEPAGPHLPADEIFSPKAERNPPPKSILSSKTVTAALTIGTGTLATVSSTVDQANQAAGPLIQAKQTATDLGLFDGLATFIHSPAAGVVMCVIILGMVAFIIGDRWMKLRNDHV